eukprot:CAMPEP_0180507990 /NCGR_PEP_ID=MMETSP1036_2-20121128/48918_1 /TAXON_ID=632150 /ORGANISM="Azadinium spinosum, Strain 3D9" /LENGTH=190 /DNA_ID=CAMNT_0022518237 /DNA_START=382 /DNA_END=951 /DNA_ORIENTATION=-
MEARRALNTWCRSSWQTVGLKSTRDLGTGGSPAAAKQVASAWAQEGLEASNELKAKGYLTLAKRLSALAASDPGCVWHHLHVVVAANAGTPKAARGSIGASRAEGKLCVALARWRGERERPQLAGLRVALSTSHPSLSSPSSIITTLSVLLPPPTIAEGIGPSSPVAQLLLRLPERMLTSVRMSSLLTIR